MKQRKKVAGLANEFFISAGVIFILITFLFVIYYTHLKLGNENFEPKVFVMNSLKVFSNIQNIPIYLERLEIDKKDHELYNKYRIENELSKTDEKDLESIENTDDSDYMHKLNCPYGEQYFNFWRKTSLYDLQYTNPYVDYGPKIKYVTFEPGNKF
jgi:hypothetical protein